MKIQIHHVSETVTIDLPVQAAGAEFTVTDLDVLVCAEVEIEPEGTNNPGWAEVRVSTVTYYQGGYEGGKTTWNPHLNPVFLEHDQLPEDVQEEIRERILEGIER